MMDLNKSVVITGASTGIGRACAFLMDNLGWRVFAGVRKETDAALLGRECSDRLTPLFLDVTYPKSVEEAAQVVEAEVGENGLSGLVNNAGIPHGGPVEFLDVNEVRAEFEVNFFGVITVTQAFLPLLRAAHGRIVNMSSISGLVSAPFVSPYSASKFALEALSDSLRMELHPWNIEVSVIEPGAIDTPIWGKGGDVLQNLLKDAPQEGLDLYGGVIHGMEGRFTPHGISADAVAKAVAHAVTSRHPKTRYPIGFEGAFVRSFRRLPDRLRDWITLSQLPKWGN
jgi:NAD(P)-dependent dehydrogenase (short-subunit alcohol dehydrogenase family)